MSSLPSGWRCSAHFELNSEPKKYVFTAKPPDKIVMFYPNIQLVGGGEATVTAVKVELIQPETKKTK